MVQRAAERASATRDHVLACSHHGGRVDEALTGVGPSIASGTRYRAESARSSRRSNEQQIVAQKRSRAACAGMALHDLKTSSKRNRPEMCEQQHAKNELRRHPVDNECFFALRPRHFLLEVKSISSRSRGHPPTNEHLRSCSQGSVSIANMKQVR